MKQLIDKDALVAEIERRKKPFIKDVEDGNYPTYLCALMDFEDFINTLEVKDAKEPKEIDFEKELYKAFGQVKDFTLCVNIAKHFYDKGYFDGHIHDGDMIAHVDGRKVNVSRFRRVAKPLEEPVSEELVEVIKRACKETRLTKAKNGHPFFSEEDFKLGFSNGSQWQKEQDQSTIELAEDHAMLAGMEKMKEEMMTKAVDVEVHVDAGGYPYIPQIELWDYDKDEPLAKEGDKYKVVLIKEGGL